MVGLNGGIGAQAAIAPIKSQAFLMSPKAFAKIQVMSQWKSEREFKCLEKMWQRESSWNPKAHNKLSGAFGIAQFLPTTWANYKLPYKPTDAGIQITGGLRYIYKRYETPCKAWAFWQKHYWY